MANNDDNENSNNNSSIDNSNEKNDDGALEGEVEGDDDENQQQPCVENDLISNTTATTTMEPAENENTSTTVTNRGERAEATTGGSRSKMKRISSRVSSASTTMSTASTMIPDATTAGIMPTFSEVLYGVPEDDELWEDFFAQPDNDSIEDDNNNNNNNNEEMNKNEDDEENNKEEGDHDETNEEEDLIIWKRQARVRGHSVNLSQLRRLSAMGIPDEGSHRGVVWRLLLGPYLPPDNIDLWQSAVKTKREMYKALCQQQFAWHNDWDYGHALRVQRKQSQGDPVLLQLQDDDDYQSIHIVTTTAPSPQQTTDTNIDMHIQPSSSHHDNNNTKHHNFHRLKQMRPIPTQLYDNPNVLEEHVPQIIQDAWTKRGKDLHILKSLMKSFNALKLPKTCTSPELVAEFVESAMLLDEIRKDVVRTHSDLAFFLDPHDDLGRRRYAAIERILFLWTKYNTSGVRYVQGMNEIVGALYYVLANDWRNEWANAAEPDSYWLLDALLDDMRDVFVPELDAIDTGIRGRISALQDLLERHDPALQEHFTEIGIDASFYAVRWLTTLLSREFLLPDTIRLWDSMFASTHKDNFLKYLCVTMLFHIRHDLLLGDFVKCIQLLQQYPSTHMDQLLESSRALYMYEMQITVACHKANLSQHEALLAIAPPPNLIMAFGFSKGIVPPPELSSSERVQHASRAVASSARNLYKRVFGKRESQRRPQQSVSEGSSSQGTLRRSRSAPLGETENDTYVDEDHGCKDDQDDIYMKAIMGVAAAATTTSTSTTSKLVAQQLLE